MYFTRAIASIAALAVGTASAAALPQITDYPGHIRYAQLRLYGEPGCFDANLGELGIYNLAVNECHDFLTDIIKSVRYEFQNNPNCRLRVYNDAECQSTPYDVAAKECLTGDDDEQYGSYELLCDES
ncbi:hypothetical protein ACRE_006570 [Hapsidospora chrysogenum ATCC 11550]|uniref:Uncharacterized protein n=1 Tax=Hapsidospora chrysogenum (strain ATCC 11550 / CBS 779.69 / DSM 880 / IAM 14645 / JCM 23072 / IMI 49137) TaxID=857340 RepID=A0A086TGA9_HAPC1|nr:hypothetical protein ACRE_006570 [Hapsidospora chrysogenum ATCC 11550]